MQQSSGGNPDFGRVAEAWEKWEDWLEPCYGDFNERLLELSNVSPGQSVLDLGCGSGQPALLEAKRVGPNGRVFAIDISEAMLAVAKRRADSLNLRNIEFQQGDIDSLPFPDDTFDAVTARFSLMFVSSPSRTLAEIFRVLRPQGKLSASVWAAAEQNPLPRNVLMRFVEVPGNEESGPGPFRYGSDSVLPKLLQSAGFRSITQELFVVHESFLSGEHYLTHLLEASALWGSALLKLDARQFQEASAALIDAAETYRRQDRVEIPRTAWLVSAAR